MKVRVVYSEGVIKIKERGKPAKKIRLRILDKPRRTSMRLMELVSRELFGNVTHTNISIEDYVLLSKKVKLKDDINVLKGLCGKGIELETAIRVREPKDFVLEKYTALRENLIEIYLIYCGDTEMTSYILIKRKGGKIAEEQAVQLSEDIMEIYSKAFDYYSSRRLDEKSMSELIETYFPRRVETEPAVERKEPEVPVEKIEKESLAQMAETKEVIEEVVEEKVEVPYEEILKCVKDFLRSEPSEFYDKVVKNKVEQVLEVISGSMERELYKLLHGYLTSSRTREDFQKFMHEASTRFPSRRYMI